jgi:serine protease
VAAQNVKAVKAALERKERGAGLSEDAALLRPLDALGWRHPVFGSLDMTALSGLFGSQLPVKNVAGRLDTLKAALGVGLRLTATTPDKARELHTKLEELRREVLEGIEGKPGAEGWAAVVKGASIRQDRDAVAIDLTVPEKLLEELQKETERASADAMSWVDQLGAGASGQTLGNDAADRAPSAVSTPVTGAEPETSRPLLSARAPVSWAPLAWAAGFATLLLLTVPRRGRPGFFGLLLSPAFALPAVLATTGFFFLVQLPVPAPWRFWLSAASLPIPDLDQLLFGASAVANPLFYSALVPFLLSPLGVRLEGARRALCGFSCGYAGALASAAWLGAPTLAWLGPAYLAVPWLVLNTLICLFAARAMLSAQER